MSLKSVNREKHREPGRHAWGSPQVLQAGNLDPKTAHHVIEAVESLVRATGLATLVAIRNMELAARMERHVTPCEGRVVELEQSWLVRMAHTYNWRINI